MEEGCSQGAVRTAGGEVLCLKAREDQKILASLHPVTVLLHLPLPRPPPGVTAVKKTGQGNAFWGLTLGREQASTRKEGVNGIMKLVGTGMQ